MNISVNPSHRMGFIQIIVASICFGFLGIFGRWATQNDLSVGVLLASRFSVAAVMLGLYFVFFAPRKLLIGWTQFAIAALQGLFGYAVFSTLYFKSIEGISVSLASLLLFTYPLWISLIHFIRGDSMTRNQGLILLAALGGLSLLFWGNFEVSSLKSLVFGLGAGLTYAIYIFISGQHQQQVHPLASSFYVILWAAFGLALFHHPEGVSWKATWMSLNPTQGLIIFGLSVVCTIIPLTLVLSSLQKLPSPTVALISMVEPVTATLAGWILLHEGLTLRQVVGGVVVLAAATSQLTPSQKNSSPKGL